MKLVTGDKDTYFAIPACRIDWIKLEDAAGGRILVKIGTGGMAHHFDYDDKATGYDFYEKIVKALEDL